MTQEEFKAMSIKALTEELELMIYGKQRECERPYQIRNALRIIYELILRHD